MLSILRKTVFSYLVLIISSFTVLYITNFIISIDEFLRLLINSGLTGMSLGLIFLWGSIILYRNMPILDTPFSWKSLHYTRSLQNSMFAICIILGGISFFTMVVLGQGCIGGLDSGFIFFKTEFKEFTNDQILITTILGTFAGLYMGAVGFGVDYTLKRGDSIGYTISILILIIGVFFSLVLSINFFKGSLLLTGAIFSRYIGVLIAKIFPKGEQIIVSPKIVVISLLVVAGISVLYRFKYIICYI